MLVNRLIEAGSRFATVFWDNYRKAANAWDTHYAALSEYADVLCPGFDQTFAALIEDLETHGMLDETLVVCISEHGRTPRLTMSEKSRGGGRGHYSQAYSAIFAGGGFAPGKVVGKTDKNEQTITDTPMSTKDILATVYHLLGIDLRRLFSNMCVLGSYVLLFSRTPATGCRAWANPRRISGRRTGRRG